MSLLLLLQTSSAHPPVPNSPSGATGYASAGVVVKLNKPQWQALIGKQLHRGDTEIYSVNGSTWSILLRSNDDYYLVVHHYLEDQVQLSVSTSEKNKQVFIKCDSPEGTRHVYVDCARLKLLFVGYGAKGTQETNKRKRSRGQK